MNWEGLKPKTAAQNPDKPVLFAVATDTGKPLEVKSKQVWSAGAGRVDYGMRWCFPVTIATPQQLTLSGGLRRTRSAGPGGRGEDGRA